MNPQHTAHSRFVYCTQLSTAEQLSSDEPSVVGNAGDTQLYPNKTSLGESYRVESRTT